MVRCFNRRGQDTVRVDCFQAPEDAMSTMLMEKMGFTGVTLISLLSDDEQNTNFFDYVNLISQITSQAAYHHQTGL